MTRNRALWPITLILCALSLVGCAEQETPDTDERVDFASSGAFLARLSACEQDYANAARKGAGVEDYNASILWSVSPYQVLVPSTGTGFINVNVDAPHFDWIIFTTDDVHLESTGGPDLEYNGPVQECPELGLVEYGAHHTDIMDWLLLIDSEPMSRAQIYIGLAPTPHSDLEQAGHAGHHLDGFGHGDH